MMKSRCMRRSKFPGSLAKCFLPLFLVLVAAPGLAEEPKAEVPVETFELANGMRFLAVSRPEIASVYAGWVAHVGSANERPGITGISHFFEHMMFKGSKVIGTTDAVRDREIIEELEGVQDRLRAAYRRQRERYRLGEIDDPFSDANRTEEMLKLEERFRELVEEQRAIMVKDEFDKIFTKNGASGLNAFTTHDLTGYVISLPANKLELWFWMESDRLSEPAFREFYTERDVVYEERRLRTESTPTGEFDELFDSMFWQSHPYGWPVVGWPSDLEVITRAQAEEYFATFYAPNNLTGILVGNFDLGEVKGLAERYFGRLAPSPKPVPDVVTLEMPQKAEKRMVGRCDCQPQVEIRYHTVPFRHPDSYALEVLAGLLNGRSGRLNKTLVLEQEVASTAFAQQDSRKYAGLFSLAAETRGEATPEVLEEELYAQLRRLQEEPIPEIELQKVKNGIAADAFRRLQSPFGLLFQLILYDGMGDWEYLNNWSEKTLAVTAQDIQRVAKTYFKPENRAVAQYFRKPGAPAEAPAPELAALTPPMRQAVEAQIRQIRSTDDIEKLQGLLQQLETHRASTPPELLPALPVLERELLQRIEAIKGSGDKATGGAA